MTTPPIPPGQEPQPQGAPAPEPAQPAEPSPTPGQPAAQPPAAIAAAQPPAVPQPPAYAPPPPQPPAQTPPQPWSAPVPPAGPAPGVRYAGHPARFVAYLVDGFIAGLLVWAVAIVFGMLTAALAVTGSDTATVLGALFTVLAVVVVSVAYFPWFWAHGGQTPGMRILRLRVVRAADGGELSAGQAVLRLIGLWISFAVFYLGVIWILFDAQRQGWHDKIAGTVVIEVA
jgi:uncharacterized RDD family membrane protein YckC